MLNFLLGFVEIDWSQSQDLTCILISEDKASAKKIKGKSGEISSGAPGDKDLLKPLSPESGYKTHSVPSDDRDTPFDALKNQIGPSVWSL